MQCNSLHLFQLKLTLVQSGNKIEGVNGHSFNRNVAEKSARNVVCHE